MNKGKWTPEQIKYLKASLGHVAFRDMAAQLGKSERAIQLYVHRARLAVSTSAVKKNIVLELLTHRFGNPNYFTPTRNFYDAVGISQVRWWRLYRGQDGIKTEEYVALAKHFNVSIEEAFELRQLDLFKDTQENNDK